MTQRDILAANERLYFSFLFIDHYIIAIDYLSVILSA